MASTLASIPEANPSGQNRLLAISQHEGIASTEPLRPRPRSRHLVFSKRRSVRIGNPIRTSPATGPPPINPGADPPQSFDATRPQPSFRPAQSSSEGPKAQLTESLNNRNHRALTPNRVSSIDQNLEFSESSVDLDSFPLPPCTTSNNNSSSNKDNKTSNIDLYQNRFPHPPVAKYITCDTDLPDYSHDEPLPGARSTRHRNPAPVRPWAGDGANDSSSQTQHTSVDSALVEAISRNICQQLRLSSAVKGGQRRLSRSNTRSQLLANQNYYAQSRTSSQKVTLDRFSQNLNTYAEHTGAKGKMPYYTPTLSRSAATFHTVSALMPFQPEFRAAGLAVTSQEQAQRIPTYITKAIESSRMPPRRAPTASKQKVQASQLDGKDRSGSSSEPNTEISFAAPQDMDEWRYALIDEAPSRKTKQSHKIKKSKSRCLPCFPLDDDQTTDADWANFRKAPNSTTGKPRPAPTGPTSRMPPPPPSERPPPPPRPPRSPIQGVDSNPSPHHRSEGTDASIKRKTSFVRQAPGTKSTGKRNPPMDLQPENTLLDAGRDEHTVDQLIPTRKCSHRPESLPRPDAELRPSKAQSDKAQLPHQRKDSDRSQPVQRPLKSFPSHKITSGLPIVEEVTEPSIWRPDHLVSSSSSEGLMQTSRKTGKSGLLAPGKRTPRSTRVKRRPVPSFDPNHAQICCRTSRGIPSRAIARPNIPRRTSSIRSSPSSTEVDYDDREIRDRDVLRGLHIAASAACDEEVDAFVRNQTGMRIRRFLADLMAIETLANQHPNDDTERQARRRRGDMRKLKRQVRRSREIRRSGMF